MADDAAPAQNQGQNPDEAGPPMAINILAQYVKDLSFENPNAPKSLQTGQGQPNIDLQVNVGVAKQDQADTYEVTLNLTGKATSNGGKDTAFIVELSYGGLFALQNVPEEHLQLFLIIEAPRMIFPFARRIFADAVRDGGFPPLMLDPIDFAQLYMAQQQRAQQQAQGGDGQGNAGPAAGGDTPNIILPN
ncbi:MAG: protein-export chaperone SecB [Pseudomonadota bacterium]